MTTEVVVSFAAAVLSGVAILVSIGLAVRQERFSARLQAQETLLAQRQLLLPLWDYVGKLRKIDAQNPVTPHVIDAVNTLELIALCCEGGLIDRSLVERTFLERYLEMYEDIEACAALPGLSKSGRDLLRENRAAIHLYAQFKVSHAAAGTVTPL